MRKDFAALPPRVQDQIARAVRGELPNVRFDPTTGIGGSTAGALFGAAILVVTGVVAANDGPWKAPLKLIFPAAALLVGSALLVSCAASLLRRRRSRVRPGVLATPILIGRIGGEGDPVEFHYLKDLTGSEITHMHHNGSYTHTAFQFQFGRLPFHFSIPSRPRAEGLIDYLSSSPGLLKGWLEEGTFESRIAELDWISASAEAAKAPPLSAPLRWVVPVLVVATTAASFAGVIGVSYYWPERREWERAKRFDTVDAYQRYLAAGPLQWHRTEALERKDDRAYGNAVRTNLARAFRGYLRDYPQGRHAAGARRELERLYAKAEEEYRAKAAKADPQAAEGMKRLLSHLHGRNAPTVEVKFLPAEDIDKTVDDVARKATGSSRVRSAAPSFSAERNRQREHRIFEIMRASFGKVFSDDLFELGRGTAGGPRFLIRYRVQASGSFYSWEREAHLPESEREIFVGIEIAFDFALQVPDTEFPPDEDPSKGWKFSMTAKPPPNISVAGDGATAVYDRMAATAFEEFEVRLANTYGLELTMPKDWGKLPGGETYTPRYEPYKIPKFDYKFPKTDLPPTTLDEVIREQVKKYPSFSSKTLARLVRVRATSLGIPVTETDADLEKRIEAIRKK